MPYDLLPQVPGGLRFADTWQMRLTVLIQAALGFIVAIVLLPVPVFSGIRLGRTLAMGEDYNAGVFIASAVTVVSAALVGIALYFAVTRLVRAIRPLEPIYGEVATGAAIPNRDRDAASYAAQGEHQ
ncbi:hypothetical protein [Curtobacterium flaccumfaciens]|uniref:hypothetical protein n=1 Tax=Curtobacterium flaccumfaciens TaxID=2035 RepID=UPI00188DC4C8|nr:hypothetical protein [Curtobacterium flaccumfaciens]MBF4629584.1 hypothetical protein [Curtobacterium flaccumfaciens]